MSMSQPIATEKKSNMHFDFRLDRSFNCSGVIKGGAAFAANNEDDDEDFAPFSRWLIEISSSSSMLCWLSSSIFSTTSVDGFAKVLSVISSSLMRGMPKAFETISATVVGSLSFLSFEVFDDDDDDDVDIAALALALTSYSSTEGSLDVVNSSKNKAWGTLHGSMPRIEFNMEERASLPAGLSKLNRERSFVPRALRSPWVIAPCASSLAATTDTKRISPPTSLSGRT